MRSWGRALPLLAFLAAGCDCERSVGGYLVKGRGEPVLVHADDLTARANPDPGVVIRYTTEEGETGTVTTGPDGRFFVPLSFVGGIACMFTEDVVLQFAGRRLVLESIDADEVWIVPRVGPVGD